MSQHTIKYTASLTSEPFKGDDVFSTSADQIHGHDGTGAVLGAHATLYHAITAVPELDEDQEVDADVENSNDVLLRLLNEVRAVDSEGDDDCGAVEVIDYGPDDNAAGVLFSVTEGAQAKAYAAPPYTAAPRGAVPGGLAPTAGTAGGFTVEGNASYPAAVSLTHLPPPPPPPPPPPAYGTPSVVPRSPYANCYSGIPQLAATPGGKPPSFREAMATAHGTPASLVSRQPPPSHECSPVLANYVPPMPTAPQETVLLRNNNGVFLLQPVSKPTPPYTPPDGNTSPPVSPLPRYSLPPAAGAALTTSAAANTFLGSSMAQNGGRNSSLTEPPHYPPFGPAGGSPYLGTAIPFSHGAGSLRGTPSFTSAPPPYVGALSRAPTAR